MATYEHLKRSAQQSFEDADLLAAEKPETAMAARADGHEALAAYLLAIGAEGWENEVRSLLRSELNRYQTFGASVRTFPQHKYLLLALALGDVPLAREIAALPIQSQNWPLLEQHVVHAICEILRISGRGTPPHVKFSSTEKVLLDSLGAIAQGKPYEPAALEGFWRALRSKRYKLTIFEHFDAFSAALKTLTAV